MGNLLGDVFFGNQSRNDRQQITDLYKTLGPLSQTATGAGQEEVGTAADYYKNLLSGNPTAEAAAIAPQENAVAAQNEAEKQRLASEGTARGGGVNAAQQQTQDAATKTGVDTLTALQPHAAAALGQLGTAETGQGLQAASQQGTLAEAERRTNLQHQAAEGSDVGKGLEAVAGLFPAGGGGGGETLGLPTGMDLGSQVNQSGQVSGGGITLEQLIAALSPQSPAPQF